MSALTSWHFFFYSFLLYKMDLQFILEEMKAAAIGAGKEILSVFNQDQSLWEMQTKDDDSPVTKADLLSNTYLQKTLNAKFPFIKYISEENQLPSYEERQQYEYYFLIDPLDGTAAFVKRGNSFSVNIALVHKDIVVAGCVYFPRLEHLYFALKGSSAFVQKSPEQTPIKLNVASFSMQQKGLRVLCSRAHHNEATQAFIDKLQEPQAVAISASLKFMKIASGEADLYPRFETGMKEWDVAANQIIIEEAGGLVLEPYTKEVLKYNKRALVTPNFIASGKILERP